MDSTRWELISDIVAQALEHEPSGRVAFVARATAGDPELRLEVDSLLREEPGSDGFLEPVPAAELGRLADEVAAGEQLGQRVGPYELQRLLGAGGMGQVYLARRVDGGFEQHVALKLVKRGMDTDRILERFRGERQVLASLEHPGIARLIDGGSTEDGRPYLVMEFVDGLPLDRWCRQRALTLVDRLTLFLDVCAAVQHAHQRLVVHRDLKPANVLVTDDGQAKLLDFGLAKLLSPDGHAGSRELTAEGERLMTPQYASPEQIGGDPVTTATDVYALGLALHELLCGRRPYELNGCSWTEVQRLVCEVDPPRPSQAGTGRETTTARELAGDLDTIVATALRKEPEQRYASAGALADDVQRFLDGLPIAARPTTISYRTSKFVRRNRLLVGSLTIIILVLAGAVFGISRQARRADKRTIEAEQALLESRQSLDNAQTVNEFMGTVLLAAAPRRLGMDATVREAVDVAASQVTAKLAQRPWVEGSVRTILGTTYRTLGSLHRALEQLELAVSIRTAELGLDDPLTLDSRYQLAMVHRDLGQTDEAAALCDELLAVWDAPQVASLAGVLALVQGNWERSQELLERALAADAALHGADHPEVLETRKHLATLAGQRGDAQTAETILRDVLASQGATLGPDHPDALITRCDLATVVRDAGRLVEAEALYRRAYEGFDGQLPDEHLDRLMAGHYLTDVVSELGSPTDVILLGVPLLKTADAALGPDHIVTDNLRIRLAWACHDLGRYADAIVLERQSVASAARVFGEDGLRTVVAQRNLGCFLLRAGEHAEAAEWLATSLDGYLRLEPQNPQTADTGCRLAQARIALGQLQQAAELLARHAPSLEPGLRGGFLKDHGSCLTRLGHYAEAEAVLLEAYQLLDETRGPDGPLTQAAKNEIVGLYDAWGRPDEARAWREVRP